MEHDDIAQRRMRVEPVDEDPLADVQGRDHRGTRNAVGLDDERLDQERQADRDHDREDELDDAADRPT